MVLFVCTFSVLFQMSKKLKKRKKKAIRAKDEQTSFPQDSILSILAESHLSMSEESDPSEFSKPEVYCQTKKSFKKQKSALLQARNGLFAKSECDYSEADERYFFRGQEECYAKREVLVFKRQTRSSFETREKNSLEVRGRLEKRKEDSLLTRKKHSKKFRGEAFFEVPKVVSHKPREGDSLEIYGKDSARERGVCEIRKRESLKTREASPPQALEEDSIGASEYFLEVQERELIEQCVEDLLVAVSAETSEANFVEKLGVLPIDAEEDLLRKGKKIALEAGIEGSSKAEEEESLTARVEDLYEVTMEDFLDEQGVDYLETRKRNSLLAQVPDSHEESSPETKQENFQNFIQKSFSKSARKRATIRQRRMIQDAGNEQVFEFFSMRVI